jgi:hypothetical protein
MAELEKEIIGSWFEIRSNMENSINLREYFDLSGEKIKKTSDLLRQSIEGGILEYKKTLFDGAYKLIESLNYDTSGLPMLAETAENINCMTYVILLQRLISKKTIRLKSAHGEDDETGESGEERKKRSFSDIGNILKEVQELVKSNQALKANKSVINIFLQMSKYRRELESMKKIYPNLPPDKKENFRLNYTKTINDIFSKIISGYEQLNEELGISAGNERKNTHPLELHDLSATSELLKRQAEIADRIKTTFVFADRERYRILDTIQTLNPYKKIFLESLDKEEKHYYNFSLSEQGKREISRQYCLEIIRLLEKQQENST